MTEPVLTEVSATVDPARAAELVEGFHTMTTQALPPGLLRTELVRGTGERWRIQSLWRDAAALEAMRAGAEPPAAPRLFRTVGAEPSLEVLTVVARHPDP